MTNEARPADAHPEPPSRPTARSAALAGLVAAAAAIGGTELLAGIAPGAPSLVVALGDLVIDLQPPGAKEFVVALFGEADKLALEVTILVAALAIAAGLGVVARRSFRLAAAGFGIAGAVGFVAAIGDPQVSPTLAALSAGLAVVIGTSLIAWLVPADDGRTTPAAGAGTAAPDRSRRLFLVRAGMLAVAAGVSGIGGRALLAGRRAPMPAGAYPPPTNLATLPPGADLQVAGITPLVVPNDRFYRIDTALLTPIVDPATWRLRIHGLVERETELSWDELLGLPMLEQYVTIACVSNEVGGNLVGNAKWTGARLRDVLEMAGVLPGATQLVGRSVDGWTAGMPTAWIMDPAREPLIAVRMNDDPLPAAHGFPARLIVPGLYGYVSATKWLSELELTTLEAFDAFWIPRGWAKEAPILTQSRIDLPRNGSSLPGDGTIALAGVAWAPDRGVARVEVAIDGEWREARISTPISDATWVQWRYDWERPPSGPHEIRVRATDGQGEVQTAERTRPDPDGARGHHAISVVVAG